MYAFSIECLPVNESTINTDDGAGSKKYLTESYLLTDMAPILERYHVGQRSRVIANHRTNAKNESFLKWSLIGRDVCLRCLVGPLLHAADHRERPRFATSAAQRPDADTGVGGVGGAVHLRRLDGEHPLRMSAPLRHQEGQPNNRHC